MITISFLAEWTLRSSLLIAGGALLLAALRVKDPAVRLLAWTAMLCGSLAIPALTRTLPQARVAVWTAAPVQTGTGQEPANAQVASRAASPVEAPFDWEALGMAVYGAVAGALLLRLAAGLAASRRMLRTARPAGRTEDGIEIRESDRVSAPVTLGIVGSTIVLPADWREWERDKLEAVLAHERSHIARRDPAVQLVSAIHRALLWHSPLSWLLHRRIVRVAEEASDDAALAVTRDRTSYAELLLEFMGRGAVRQGVAMARYGLPEERIDRILNGTALSPGLTRWAVVAIVALGSPLAYLAAAAYPQAQPPLPPSPPAAPAAAPQAPEAPEAPPLPPAPPQTGAIRRYQIHTDNMTMGSWDSNHPIDDEALRKRFGHNYVWFWRDGNEYVVNDAGVMGELQKAMEPQKKVNAMQEQVNAHQEKVNTMQTGVNSQQNEVNALQQDVNRRQELMNRIQNSANSQDQQALIREMEAALAQLRTAKGGTTQDAVNRRQGTVNEAQQRVNAEQHVVNEEQQKVNEEQHRVSADLNGKIGQILDSAVRRGVAHRLM